MVTKQWRLSLLPLLSVFVGMTGCDSSYKHEAENSHLPISSCNMSEMSKINVNALSPEQKSDICLIMVSSIHRMPPVFLLKDFERFVSLVKSTAADETVNVIATQTMSIVKARKQQNDNEGMQNTFETVWRIYQNTQTHVTLNDLSLALKKSGMQASNMSDEALEQFGLSLWRQSAAHTFLY